MLTSRSVARALRDPSALRDPNFRAFITASAATAPWRRAEAGRIGWWQHDSGGFGWVGPLFWPFAYDDIYDYAIWGYGPPFWGYGYGDIYAAIFAPYEYSELTGYFARYSGGRRQHFREALAPFGRPNATSNELAQMCGTDSPDIVDLPIDDIRQAIQLTDEQRTALDDLAKALAKAAQDIKAACPTDIALTATGRLGAMQLRLEVMVAAVETVQAPLEKFYGLLDDEGKARLTALADEQRRNSTEARTSASLTQSCGAAQQANGMADRRDRSDGSSDRGSACEPYGTPERRRQGGGYAQGLMPAGQRSDAIGAARRGCQTTRHHAASGKAGADGAQRFLRNADRRAKGAVRGDRAAAHQTARLTLQTAEMFWHAPRDRRRQRFATLGVDFGGERRLGRYFIAFILSVTTCVQAPVGGLVMTGSDPAESSSLTVR